MNSVDAALDKIEEISEISKSTEHILIELFKHADSEIRYRVIEKFFEILQGDSLPQTVLGILLLALKDEDELVRCEALEVFEFYPSEIKYLDVLPFLNDGSGLVSSRAAILLGAIGDSRAADEIRKKILRSEDEEKAGLYFGLYLLHDESALGNILSLLSSPSYLARCAAANLLPDCVSESNRQQIIASLENAKSIENTVAANSSINNSLRLLQEK